MKICLKHFSISFNHGCQMRELNRYFSKSVTLISALFAIFYLYTAGFGIFSTQSNRGVYLLCTLILCLILYPLIEKRPYHIATLIIDGSLVLFGGASIIYWMWQYADYAAFRVGLPNRWDIFFGFVLIIVSLEVTRRVMGWILAILGFLFVLQLFIGPYLPGTFAHKGFNLVRVIEFNYSTMEGIFGTVLSVFATYVMPFIVFGVFLQQSGGGAFFIDLARALAGNISGGPAIIAIWGSAIFGSMSGSPVANVVSTGSFTIPMMKKVGFKSEFAGAVEAAASTGGQFLPPIMGAAAFILATLTETPYSRIVVMAIVPALLYYLSLTSMVYFRAKLIGISGIPRKDLPQVSVVMRSGWYFAFILVMAVALIIKGYSPPVVAFWATVFVWVCSYFKKETRLTPARLFDIFSVAGRTSLTVGSAVGTLGLIMGGITLSGLGISFSQLLLSVSGGNIFIAIILIAIIATIVGMGLPTAASYIVLAILAAPSLVQLGVPVVNAHMMCFWLAMTSNITPPVCVAAFAASSIAKGDPMKTGFHACSLGLFLYLCPFAFVYTPQILLVDENVSHTLIVITSFVMATIALSATVQGWLFKRLAAVERILYLISAVLLITPNLITDIAGLIAFCALVFWSFNGKNTQSAKAG